MIHVLHLAEGATFAGIETHILALARSLPDEGVRLSAATFAEGELTTRLRDLGIATTVLKRAHKLDRKPVAEIAALLRGGGQLCHAHGYLADAYGLRAARLARAPAVATVHGHPERFRGTAELKMRLYMWMDARNLASMNRVVAVSKPLAGDLESRGIKSASLTVIENGLPESGASSDDVRKMRETLLGGADPNAALIGYAGRFDPVKAPLRFIETARLILERLPNARFALAGDGPLLESCKSAAHATGKPDAFRFLGFRKNLDELIGACDLIVMPSDSEGVPQVLLAAMRDGAVPICSAVGGIPDVLGGFAECTARPAAAELAEKALAVLGAPAKRADLARRLKERFAERFTAKAMARWLGILYREVLKS